MANSMIIASFCSVKIEGEDDKLVVGELVQFRYGVGQPHSHTIVAVPSHMYAWGTAGAFSLGCLVSLTFLKEKSSLIQL